MEKDEDEWKLRVRPYVTGEQPHKSSPRPCPGPTQNCSSGQIYSGIPLVIVPSPSLTPVPVPLPVPVPSSVPASVVSFGHYISINHKHYQMAMDFVAGCIGGCAGVVVGHPFDTIKVRLQTQNGSNPLYKSGMDCFRSIVKNESAAVLYRGMSSPLAGVAVVNAVVFGVQANLQRNLPNPDSLSSHFVSGAAAGISQSVICSPVEMVKTQLQIQKNELFKSPLECLIHIYRTQGLRGVFRGLGVTTVREAPGYGTYFLVYEMLTRSDDRKPISTLHMLLAGGTAGSASWVAAYPIDVIKTRLQVDGISGPRKYKNAIDCCIKSVQADGISCLTRGLGLTVVRAFPVNAATWATVTWVIRLADKAKEKEAELRDASLYLPAVSSFAITNLTLTARASSPQHRYWDKDTLTRSSAHSCEQDSNVFRKLFQSVPRFL